MDAVWWKDYLHEVLKAVPLQGPDTMRHFEPLKEEGPSSSIDPDFLMDEEEEVEADYSRLFDVSPPQAQSSVHLEGIGPSETLLYTLIIFLRLIRLYLDYQ